MDAACEGEWTSDRLLEAGERIWNLERDFNIKAGFTGADDTLPKRLLEEPARSGPAEGRVSGVPEMMPKYYEERGWTVNGELTDAVRSRLRLPA
jgi:aldehyde:ferredoxin oxidoreductase